MSNAGDSREVRIVNKLGLHARAAAKLVTLASRFECRITVRRADQEVDAKSIMAVMMLAASKGTVVELKALGDDAAQALDDLEQLINDRFGEPE